MGATPWLVATRWCPVPHFSLLTHPCPATCVICTKPRALDQISSPSLSHICFFLSHQSFILSQTHPSIYSTLPLCPSNPTNFLPHLSATSHIAYSNHVETSAQPRCRTGGQEPGDHQVVAQAGTQQDMRRLQEEQTYKTLPLPLAFQPADALIAQILAGPVGTSASSSASAAQASTEAWASTSAVSNPSTSIPGPTNK